MSQFLEDISATIPATELDLDLVGDTHNPLRVVGLSVVSLQASNITGAWGSGVVTIQRSNDGIHWSAFSPAATVSAADGFVTVTAVCCTWVRAIVTTAGTAGHKVSVSLCGRPS